MRLEPMTAAEYADYRETAEQGYAAGIAAAGAMTEAEALAKAADDYQRFLPDGPATPGQYLWTAWVGDVPVGVLWLKIEKDAFVYDVEVRPQHRRKGYGRAIMRAAEAEAAARGATSIGLTVWAANDGAKTLYESMGYATTSTSMRKHLNNSYGAPGRGPE